MLVTAANTCIFQTFTLFTVDIPRCLAMFPVLLFLEPLFGSSLTKIRREISKNLLVFQISFAPCRGFLASRHKSICQKTYVCPHESSSEKDAPKKFELSSLRRHIQKPKTNFFPLPQHPKNNSNLQIEKLPVSPTPYRKLNFFGTYLPLVWAIPFFSKHLMTFNNPNLTIYLLWSS